MPALTYRSPQQQSISNDIYQAYLRHYNYDGAGAHGATLTHPPIGLTSYPFIYTLNAPTGWGKCHGIDTPIIMFDGSIKMVQDIQVGDKLMGPDSKPKIVKSLARGRDEMFNIVPTKGDPFVCNSVHVLSLRYGATGQTPLSRDKGEIWNVPLDEYILTQRDGVRLYKLWRTGVDFPGRDVAIDPWLIGYHLGNGRKGGHHLSVNRDHHEVQDYIRTWCRANGYQCSHMQDERGNVDRLGITTGEGNGVSHYRNAVRECLTGANERHIPDAYLFNSEANRMQLLAGLIDSDGHFESNRYEISCKDAHFAKQVMFLARSLNFYVKEDRNTTYVKNFDFTGTYSKIRIYGDTDRVPVKLSYKKASIRGQIKNHQNTGFSIESLGEGDYYGFTLDGDGLYLLGDFTVTHNTNIGMEPLRFITSAISSEDLNKERWLPMDLEEYAKELGPLAAGWNDSELAKHMRGQIALESAEMFEDPEASVDDGANYFQPTELSAKLRAAMLEYRSEAGGLLPLALDDGAMAVFVRTRSQTQAFLREAKRKDLNSIALPSKASVCMNNRVQRSANELMDLDLSITTGDSTNAATILGAFYSELDGTNPTKELTPYNPAIHRSAARLHSHACDSCSKCPLNLSFQSRTASRLENGSLERLEGAAAEAYLIYRSGMVDPESYMAKVVERQQETQDLEESTKALWEQHPTICPYPTIRNSLPDFDFIILTYPYLFNPQVTEVMSEYIGHVRHVLVDEGHNISQLYGQLTTRIYPGASPNNFKMSSSLYDFDIVRESHIRPLEKELSKGLFGDKYIQNLEAMQAAIRSKSEGYSSEWVRKKAREALEEDGVFNPTEAIALYDQMELRIKQLGVWLAVVQHRYIKWYTELVTTHGEEKIGMGFEPMPTHVLEILFGASPIKGQLQGERDEDDNELYYTSLANSPSANGMRTGAHDINLILRDLNALRVLTESGRTTVMRRSQNTHIASIARACDLACRNTLKACEDLLALAQALIPVFPVEMANWFTQAQVDSRSIDTVFIHYNPYVYDSENTSKYYLNGRINYQALLLSISRVIADWEGKLANEADYIDHESEDKTPVLPVGAAVSELMHLSEYPKGRKLMDLRDLEAKTREAYELGCVDQELVNALHGFGLNFPTYRYDNVFPYSDWKLYYRYWDGLFEVVPLTLSRLLAKQFSQFRTVGLISGTFPPRDYIKAFWGLQPYEFKVTEQVGKMDYVLARGASSKFDQRSFSYEKWASLIQAKYAERCAPTGKSMIAAFPSKAVTSEVVSYLADLMPSAHFWPNAQTDEDAIDVNAMIEQLNECIASGIPKVFLVTMGSRFTEGVEYVDAEGNSMLNTAVVAGIQYPSRDIHIENMQKHVVETYQYTEYAAFELIQSEAAYQKVRQAAGRTIRSHGDQAEIVLADSRFAQKFWQERMPTHHTIDI